MSVYKIILFIVDMNGKYSVKCILFLKAHLHLVRKELYEQGLNSPLPLTQWISAAVELVGKSYQYPFPGGFHVQDNFSKGNKRRTGQLGEKEECPPPLTSTQL